MSVSTSNSTSISVQQYSAPLVAELIANAPALGCAVSTHESGATIVDAGIQVPGGLEAGRIIAEICMGGLGSVALQHVPQFAHWPLSVVVTAKQPVIACLGSQYAGWALSHEKFFSLGSGPARAIAQREEVFKEINYRDQGTQTVLVLETDKIPPLEVIEKVARDTGLAANKLTFILTPTRSLAGSLQVTARVLEVALHKCHTLHFDLNAIVDGYGVAPIPAPSPDFIVGMGRTNDAILFGGFVQLFVNTDDAAAEQLATQLPSSASKDYGRPFAEVFKAVNMDFYQIDPMLFSPAKVSVTNLKSGRTFFAGQFNEVLLNQSFGG
ncbi:methenyltetrahydromethanopterin cyclohydrolase [Methylophilus medardicus]|uniref:Methenyltetrahydromethanopterin cyclohydrolase n=1 Tax=Methylophilus medardicus TaxID=2588534 RepID=A0A5B8CSC3_9PROT|nr:methenyltetrahydromethanopterin cyclohydrolase [Methylophilus medardicus]QDC44218.1 methenyltetrahydromethanopterin cyclohydrolase [Methylophilus medardicus]QDC49225.1 methenyltetrahydromethanopterin cyclohydrolase [Methylophilus medardicus]QDC52930.1 methenyltetrahydromethanopterin cyclohydrolase [Methylophilus medardicus]